MFKLEVLDGWRDIPDGQGIGVAANDFCRDVVDGAISVSVRNTALVSTLAVLPTNVLGMGSRHLVLLVVDRHGSIAPPGWRRDAGGIFVPM